MKKLILALCFALVSLCGMARTEGEMAIGAEIGVYPVLNDGVDVTNFGFGLKFQYNVTDPVRIEGAFDYLFRDKGVDAITIALNTHYLIDVNRNFAVYPIIGMGYGNIGGLAYEIDYGHGMKVESKSLSRFLFNIGIGGEYAVSPAVSLGMEFKYRYMKDFGALPITLGVTYHF